MTDPLSDLKTQKTELRQHMRRLRLVVDQKDGPDAAMAAMRHFFAGQDLIGLREDNIVAAYWPISTEIDPRPIIGRLDDRGIRCALPVVTAPDEPLIFREWRPTDPLEAGSYEIQHPVATAREVRPDVILVPILAVDAAGWRLGQGGGYFDRTLAQLRNKASVTAVGIGFFIQRVDHVPHDDRDQPVDWILTDRELTPAVR